MHCDPRSLERLSILLNLSWVAVSENMFFQTKLIELTAGYKAQQSSSKGVSWSVEVKHREYIQIRLFFKFL